MMGELPNVWFPLKLKTFRVRCYWKIGRFNSIYNMKRDRVTVGDFFTTVWYFYVDWKVYFRFLFLKLLTVNFRTSNIRTSNFRTTSMAPGGGQWEVRWWAWLARQGTEHHSQHNRRNKKEKKVHFEKVEYTFGLNDKLTSGKRNLNRKWFRKNTVRVLASLRQRVQILERRRLNGTVSKWILVFELIMYIHTYIYV
jgi:hypothetical protein